MSDNMNSFGISPGMFPKNLFWQNRSLGNIPNIYSVNISGMFPKYLFRNVYIQLYVSQMSVLPKQNFALIISCGTWSQHIVWVGIELVAY